MYSLLLMMVVLVGIHFSYKHLERRAAFVPNVLESQSKARFDELTGELKDTEKGKHKQPKTAPKEDDVKRKEELNSFLEELKQTPSSKTNVPTTPQT